MAIKAKHINVIYLQTIKFKNRELKNTKSKSNVRNQILALKVIFLFYLLFIFFNLKTETISKYIKEDFLPVVWSLCHQCWLFWSEGRQIPGDPAEVNAEETKN
ncbi:hypothetical protein V6Z11_A05G279000 [Gossypium hirsutum]